MSSETYSRECPKCHDYIITDLAKGPCHLCLRRAGKEKYPKPPAACRHPKAKRWGFDSGIWCASCGSLYMRVEGVWRKPTGAKP